MLGTISQYRYTADLVDNSFIIYDPLAGTVYSNGQWDDQVWDGEYWVNSNVEDTGIWDRSPIDKIARYSPLTVSDGVIDINLTAMHKQSQSPLYDGLYYSIDRP